MFWNTLRRATHRSVLQRCGGALHTSAPDNGTGSMAAGTQPGRVTRPAARARAAAELGPLASLLLAPEQGTWGVDEVTVASSRTGHTDRFVCREPLGGAGAGFLAPVPPGAVVYGSGEAAVVLSRARPPGPRAARALPAVQFGPARNCRMVRCLWQGRAGAEPPRCLPSARQLVCSRSDTPDCLLPLRGSALAFLLRPKRLIDTGQACSRAQIVAVPRVPAGAPAELISSSCVCKTSLLNLAVPAAAVPRRAAPDARGPPPPRAQEQAALLHELGMMDYVSLKDRLLAATTALVIAGTCLAYSVRRRGPAGAAADGPVWLRSAGSEALSKDRV